MLRFVSHPRYLAQYLANDNIWKFLINWTKIWKCNPKPRRRQSIWPALRVILSNPRSFTAVIGSGGRGGFGPHPTATITRCTEINSTFWYHILDVLLKGPLRTAEVLHPFSARITADRLCLQKQHIVKSQQNRGTHCVLPQIFILNFRGPLDLLSNLQGIFKTEK